MKIESRIDNLKLIFEFENYEEFEEFRELFHNIDTSDYEDVDYEGIVRKIWNEISHL